MLEKIKKVLFKTYNSEEKKGVFLSWFDKEHTLLSSEWVVDTKKPLHETVDTVYKKAIVPHLKEVMYVACDIVSDIIEIREIKKVLDLSPKEFWFVVVDQDDDTSWVILPNTEWVSDAKSALSYIKKKYGIHGKVEIYAFRTERIIVSK